MFDDLNRPLEQLKSVETWDILRGKEHHSTQKRQNREHKAYHKGGIAQP